MASGKFQGLMQVMTKIHDDKYEAFGGRHAAFDPVTNLRVGVQVLKDVQFSLRAGEIHRLAHLGNGVGEALAGLADYDSDERRHAAFHEIGRAA